MLNNSGSMDQWHCYFSYLLFDQLFNRTKLVLKLNNIDIALLMFYIYIFIRSVLTPYTPILYNTRFLNYSLLLIFYFIIKSIYAGLDLRKEKSRLDDGKKKGEIIPFTSILVLVLISTGLVQAVWGLLQLYGITRSFHSGFKITGTFFNPAPYALYLAVIFPLALGNVLRMNKLETISNNRMTAKGLITYMRNTSVGEAHKVQMTIVVNKLIYYISLITVFSIILVLPATMNRASWLGVIIGSLYVLSYRYNLLALAKLYLNSAIRKAIAVTLFALLIGLSGIALYQVKKGSSDGKLLIWEVTTGKIAKKPLFGYGVGRFEADYNNWQADYFKSHPGEMDGPKGMASGNTKYCFNEYLEMAAELGIIGLLLFIAVIASVFFGIRKGILTTNNAPSTNDNLMTASHQLTQKATFIPSSISLLVMGLISFPFYSLPSLLISFLILTILSSNVKGDAVLARLIVLPGLRRFSKVASFSSLTSISVLLFFLVRQQYKSFAAFEEAEMLYQSGNYIEACSSFSENYSRMSYKGAYLQYYGKALSMNEEYSRSIEVLERSALYTSDEILYSTIGDTYKGLKRYSEAEKAYLHASFMVPHKLYPQYLLANLYYETGQNGKAYLAVKTVLNKKIKVESTATKEIIEAMLELSTKLKN